MFVMDCFIVCSLCMCECKLDVYFKDYSISRHDYSCKLCKKISYKLYGNGASSIRWVFTKPLCNYQIRTCSKNIYTIASGKTSKIALKFGDLIARFVYLNINKPILKEKDLKYFEKLFMLL